MHTSSDHFTSSEKEADEQGELEGIRLGLEVSMPKVSILVVESNEAIILELETSLGERFHLVPAKSLEEASKLLEMESFAVVIGRELGLFEKLAETYPNTVRIALVERSEVDEVVEAINQGRVAQLILRPWNDSVVRKILEEAVAQYSLIAKNQELQDLIYSQHQALARNHETLRRELRLGSKIQEVMLTGRVPTDVPNIGFETMTVPSTEIDGDFYDFYRPSDETLDLVVGDVMGKGLPAALVGTAIKAQLHRFAVPTLPQKSLESLGVWQADMLEPKEVLRFVHHSINKQLLNLEYFVSLFYVRFSLWEETFTYVDCGAAKPIHFSEGKAVLLEGENFPVGTVDEAEYTQIESSYKVGDVFVFYSDGVSEVQGKDSEIFGSERLRVIVEKSGHLSCEALLDEIRAEIRRFSGREFFDDDLTLIVVKILDGFAPTVEKMKPIQARFNSDLSQLVLVRDLVQRAVAQLPGGTEELSERLQLAINEAFCNIVKHGYQGKSGYPVQLECRAGPKGVLFELCDQGASFDPTDVAEPNFAGERDSGFGLFILREIADRITYRPKSSADRWNRLQIFKRYAVLRSTMHITHSLTDQVLVIELENENLDARGAPAFKQKVIDLADGEGATQLVFNLSHLKFIDSSGLGCLLSILKMLKARGGDLKLAALTKQIRAMFEIVRMHKLFEIFNTVEEAVASFDG